MAETQRWKLQIYWCGDWRTIMEAESRHILVEYANRCPEDVELRIVDSEEEVKKHGQRRNH